MTKIATLLLVLILCWTPPLPAEAVSCLSQYGHEICILSIKRSAKYHWEYRATLRVDGVERPTELYNCRDRIRVRQDGTATPFEPNGPGELICRLLEQ